MPWPRQHGRGRLAPRAGVPVIAVAALLSIASRADSEYDYYYNAGGGNSPPEVNGDNFKGGGWVFEIEERLGSSEKQQLVGQISATDADDGDELTFALVDDGSVSVSRPCPVRCAHIHV